MQVQSNPVPVTPEKTLSPQVNEKQIGKADTAGKKVPTGTNDSSNAEKSQTKENTSIYLKVISRLESKLVEKKLPEGAIENFSKAVETRLDELTEQQKQLILQLEEFKALKVDKTEKLPEIIQKGLEDEKKADDILKLLKNPKFAELMDRKADQQSKTYSPQNMVAKPKPVPASEGEGSKSVAGVPSQPPPQSPVTQGSNAPGGPQKNGNNVSTGQAAMAFKQAQVPQTKGQSIAAA